MPPVSYLSMLESACGIFPHDLPDGDDSLVRAPKHYCIMYSRYNLNSINSNRDLLDSL